MNTAVSVKDLQFTYPSYSSAKSKPLFIDLEGVFHQGIIHVVFGRPESGKTTFGRLLAGLVPAFTGGNVSGSVLVDAVQVLETRGCHLLEHVGLVFQDPDEQILMAQVEDEIVFPLESMSLNRPQMHERLEAEVSFWDLDDLRSSNPGDLSGGEKKRLLLAVLCAVNPAVWILDETFEELDEQWREVLIKRAVESGRTVIILASKHIPLYDLYVSTWSIIDNNQLYQGPREEALQKLGDNWEYKKIHPSLPYISGDSQYQREPVISIRHLSFSYPGSKSGSDFTLYVDNLDIYSGQITAFYGPNGSGKSTLSKLLCGLISPERGEILIPGKGGRLRHAAPGALQRYTGYLFQNPDYQIFLPTIKDELMYSLLQAGIEKSDARAQAATCGELFGLYNLKDTPATMSYGSRKRLQAAVCYQLDRICTIFDEADSGILLAEYIRIIDLFVKRESSLIIITHDLRLAEKLADTVVQFQDGRARKVEGRRKS
ncbi:MAG: energy-coupling factor ABC transporter ATP-binding protein [Spirochaetia bacterium]|nr:energy-coupling factor ABC transporter ATP-binding protein [Spirochaetia bacterium]